MANVLRKHTFITLRRTVFNIDVFHKKNFPNFFFLFSVPKRNYSRWMCRMLFTGVFWRCCLKFRMDVQEQMEWEDILMRKFYMRIGRHVFSGKWRMAGSVGGCWLTRTVFTILLTKIYVSWSPVALRKWSSWM